MAKIAKMSTANNEVNTYFGKCRCCLNYGYLKNMWEEHYWDGGTEIYVEMLVQCFALSWEHSDESMQHDQICETCIKRLRDAHEFKKVILDSQEELLRHVDVISVVGTVESSTSNTEGQNEKKSKTTTISVIDTVESSTPNVEDQKEGKATTTKTGMQIKTESEWKDEIEKLDDCDSDGDDNMYIDDPDDPNYVDPNDPTDGKDPVDPQDPNMEYEEVEYLEDEDSLAGQNPEPTRVRSKTPTQTKPENKWPQRLPKTLRYKTYKQYTEEDLRKCIETVRNREMSCNKAALKYNIPVKTIIAKSKLGPKDVPYKITLRRRRKESRQKGSTFFHTDLIYKFKENVRIIIENSNATPIKGHWGIGYGCSYCPFQNPTPSKLKTHTLETHFDVVESIKTKSYIDLICKLDITGLQCNICEQNFNLLEQFTSHLSLKHDIKIYTDIKDFIIPFKFDTDNLLCALCSKQFDYFKYLSGHMNEHYSNYECNTCSRTFINKRSLRSHLFRHQTGVFVCSYCSKIFNTRIKMKEHERVLHLRASKTRKCGYCDEKFMDANRKTIHEVSVHGAPMVSFECKACGKKYDSQRALKCHTDQYHLMLKPHKCDECGKGFYYKNELKRHMVRHTGNKEFQCEICSKWYSSRKSLKVHLKTHEIDTKYKCHSCGLTLVSQSNWIQHLRSTHQEEI